MTVLDLFAGPGGWDLAARDLGLDPLGVEWDEAACLTREAAGLRTLWADVSELDPADFAPCEVLIASPPCQAWSMAGKRGGERDKQHVVRCALELAAGSDTRAEHRSHCEDERSILVVEPLRWALALEPDFLAFEQVPPVLELWSLYAQILGERGWRAWAGVLSAERFGVPQTRRRAILMGSRVGPVEPPRATHQAYVKGEPQRHEVTLDGELLPWVSMAEALGWDVGVPAPTVTAGGGESGGVEVFARGGACPDRPVALRVPRGGGMTERHGDRRDHPVSEPAPAVRKMARSAVWVNGNQANAARRGGA